MSKTPKKILHVVGAMNIGGAETFLMNVLRNINRDEYEFIFLCYIEGDYDYAEELNRLGCKVLRIPDTRITNPLGFVKQIENMIIKEKINIVHSHVDFTSGYAMLAAKNAGINMRIAHAHSASVTRSMNLLRHGWLKILRWLMNHYATERIACGEDAGKFMFGSNTFQIIRNGVDVTRFEFNAASRATIRHQLNIRANDTVFLHIGRFESVKNHDFLIDIFSRYYAHDRMARLILLGDGSLFNVIKKKVSELGLESAVQMLGKQTNTEDYYSASDLFIMPSLYEGLPVTLIEAQMNGLGCLVSDVIDRSVDYGSVNFYSLQKNAEEWSGQINSIKRKHLTVSEDLMNEYDIKKVTNQLQEIYESK